MMPATRVSVLIASVFFGNIQECAVIADAGFNIKTRAFTRSK
jgi:hypothetical protein